MALRLENPEAERLAKDLAAASAQTCEQDTESLFRDLDQIATTFARHATHDNRSADKIIGYDENGLPR